MPSRFVFHRVTRDPSGYYHTRWDRAVPVTVLADTEPDAVKKARKISGPVYGGRRGDVWAFRLASIEEITGGHDSAEPSDA